MELECLLRQVRSKINFSLQCGEDSAVAGWRQKEGILMTRDNAVQLLKKIESLTAEVERLRERDLARIQFQVKNNSGLIEEVLSIEQTFFDGDGEMQTFGEDVGHFLAKYFDEHGLKVTTIYPPVAAKPPEVE